MVTRITAKPPLHQRAMHELRQFLILAIYLYVTLGSVILMKAAILHTAGVPFAFWGLAIVKAALLAKFMLVGNAMKIGRRFVGRPLIWPTLHRSVAFLMLLIILTTLEEVVVGLFHHRTVATSLGDLYGARLEETLAGFLIMLLLLIPYFAFRMLDDALGEGTLLRMFLVEPRRVERP